MLSCREVEAERIEDKNVVATSWIEYPGAGMEANDTVMVAKDYEEILRLIVEVTS